MVRPTRGQFVETTVDVLAAAAFTFTVTQQYGAFMEWVRENPGTIPPYLDMKVMTEEFLCGAAEAFTRIAMGEDPETMHLWITHYASDV